VYFSIFKSVDGGETWKEISKVTDQVNSWRLCYQPFLCEMPVSVGKYPAGTILCAGNSIPTDLSYTKIDVHASFDKEIHVEICLPRSLRGYGNSRQWNSCHLGAPHYVV
jgi:hypothetical protein